MASDHKAPAAGVVISDGRGKYLLIQENWGEVKGLWNLPAGVQDPGEELHETAAREAKEEVGLTVRIPDAKPLFVKVSDRSGRTLYSYAAEVVEGTIKTNPAEISQAKWLTLEQIESLKHQGKLRDNWVLKSAQKAEAKKCLEA